MNPFQMRIHNSKQPQVSKHSLYDSQHKVSHGQGGQKSNRIANDTMSKVNYNKSHNYSKNQFQSSGRASTGLKRKLIEFLVAAAQAQRKLQILKQTLCEQEQFTPISLFNRIDRQRTGYLLESDIQQFLISKGISYKGSQLKILYGKMNRDKNDNGVVLWQFQTFILPNQNPRLRYFTMRRPPYIPLPDQLLDEKVQWLLSKLFEEIMKNQAELRQINAALINTYDFNAVQVFELMANAEGFITGQSLNQFMLSENVQLSVQEIGCLIKLIDRKGEGCIHIDDFKVFLATLNLKKVHEIFDELSPVPALKDYVAPMLVSILNRDQTLRQRVNQNNKSIGRTNNTRSPTKKVQGSTAKKSKGNQSSKKKN